jgi:hypothetical protein
MVAPESLGWAKVFAEQSKPQASALNKAYFQNEVHIA